jgi:hypothetical protein
MAQHTEDNEMIHALIPLETIAESFEWETSEQFAEEIPVAAEDSDITDRLRNLSAETGNRTGQSDDSDDCLCSGKLDGVEKRGRNELDLC